MPREPKPIESLASVAEVSEQGEPATVKLEGVTGMSVGGGSIGPLPAEGATVEYGVEVWDPGALEVAAEAAGNWIDNQRKAQELRLADASEETADLIRGNLATLDDYAKAVERGDTGVIKVLSEYQQQAAGQDTAA